MTIRLATVLVLLSPVLAACDEGALPCEPCDASGADADVPRDAGALDAGRSDAATRDAGRRDAALVDARAGDAARPDGGPSGECAEHDFRPCIGPGVGACSPGVELCVDGAWSGVCDGVVTSRAESCDGADDDCDGVVDEGGAGCPSGANAAAVCRAGTCQHACDAGFADCDGDPSNGCERDLASGPCGACPMRCAWGCGVDGCLRAVAIAIGDVFRCYLLSDGDVACSGDILPGTTVEDPVRVPGVHDAIGLAASARAACAVLRDGSVWCWGANLHGALGRGFVTTAETTRFDAEPVPGLSDVVGVGAGVAHHCAVHADGSVSCWGWNAAGQLGDDTTSSRASPAPAASYGDVDLVVGTTTTTCARVATGRVTCWGQGELLGDGSSVGRRTPGAPVRGVARVIAMDGGYRHVCAVADDGRAFCWGDNWTGGLGVETPSERPLWPVLAGGLTDAVAIAAGGSSTCAVRVGGGVRCWGDSSQRHDAVRVVDLGAVLPAMGPWIAYGEHRRGAIDRAGVPWVIAGPPFPALSPAP